MSAASFSSRLRPTFQVPATRGRMGTTKYYTATLPFGAVTKLFTFDPDKMLELTPENRSQRTLIAKRVPEIAEYVLDHDDYIFSSITVSVDSDEVEFLPVEEEADIGNLVLPLEAKYVINDGQHRVAGISEALRQDPQLAEDTISVVVLPDGGLERSQQIFSDLNRTVRKTSKSLDILFDHRLPINRITMACLEGVPLFEDRIDKERVSLSVRSPKFATLSGLQQANIQFLGNPSEKLPRCRSQRTDRPGDRLLDPPHRPRDALARNPRRRRQSPGRPAGLRVVLRVVTVGPRLRRRRRLRRTRPRERALDRRPPRALRHRLAEDQPGLARNLHGRERSRHPSTHQASNRHLRHVETRPRSRTPRNSPRREALLALPRSVSPFTFQSRGQSSVAKASAAYQAETKRGTVLTTTRRRRQVVSTPTAEAVCGCN